MKSLPQPVLRARRALPDEVVQVDNRRLPLEATLHGTVHMLHARVTFGSRVVLEAHYAAAWGLGDTHLHHFRLRLETHEAALLFQDEPCRFCPVDHGAELLAASIRTLCSEELLRSDWGRRHRRREVVGVHAPCGLGHQEARDVVIQLFLVQTRRGDSGKGIGEMVVRPLLVLQLEVNLR